MMMDRTFCLTRDSVRAWTCLSSSCFSFFVAASCFDSFFFFPLGEPAPAYSG